MGEAARRNPKDFKIEILLAIVGLGATAGGFALPLIYPHFPWWIPATILFVGTALFITGIVEILILYRPSLKLPARIVGGALFVVVSGLMIYYKPPKPGPCSTKLNIESIRSILFEAYNNKQNTTPRLIQIFVDQDKLGQCQYAEDLYTAFSISGWNPSQIMGDKLIGYGVWFHGPDGDPLIKAVYAQLWESQPVRLDLGPSDKKHPTWIFWIKDTWPRPFQNNE
jgi:hypothetical protein